MTTARFGAPVLNWSPAPRPGPEAMEGRAVRLERLNADAHAADLFRAFSGHDALWDYLPYGPFASASAYHHWVRGHEGAADPFFYVLRDRASGHCAGVASFLRIMPEAGSIEVGHICLSPEIQQTRAATEAMALMMGWAFASGYRRYEWKCDALNLPSRRAADRLGFTFEGVFRQASVVKRRNRDTAWYSVIDSEWPALSEAYGVWLSPANFDAGGRQKVALSDLTRRALGRAGPAV